MKAITNRFFKKCSSKGVRRFLILLTAGLMFLISYVQTFALTINTIPESQNISYFINENGVMTSHSVEISIFRGRILAEPNLLIWQTIREKNNRGFEVERSKDGITWDMLAFVEGQGTTKETHEYEFSDEKPFKGTTYYRLKQIDTNGEYEYSKTIIVERKTKLTEEIWVQNE